MNRNYICADWGGSEIKGVCLTSAGVVRSFKFPSQNIRSLQAKTMAFKALQMVNAAKALPGSGNLWLIGCAGGDDKQAAHSLKRAILEADSDICGIEVYSDYVCNHAACFGGGDGILSINGTGSVIFGSNQTKAARFGGWGYLIDTLPSGAYFGKLALEGLLRCLDGDNTYEDYLSIAMRNKIFDNDDKMHLKSLITDELYKTKTIQRHLAGFSQVLAEAYFKGNRQAVSALNRSIDELGDALRFVGERIDLSALSVCGSGGLWKNFKGFDKLVKESCLNKKLNICWNKPMFDLSIGPLVLFSKSDKKSGKILEKYRSEML